MGKDKQHVVVGNGVIRSKAEIAEFKKRIGEEDVAEEDAEDAAEDAEAGGPQNGTHASISNTTSANGDGTPASAHAEVGNNTSAKNNNKPSATNTKPKTNSTNQQQAPHSDKKLKTADSVTTKGDGERRMPRSSSRIASATAPGKGVTSEKINK